MVNLFLPKVFIFIQEYYVYFVLKPYKFFFLIKNLAATNSMQIIHEIFSCPRISLPKVRGCVLYKNVLDWINTAYLYLEALHKRNHLF